MEATYDDSVGDSGRHLKQSSAAGGTSIRTVASFRSGGPLPGDRVAQSLEQPFEPGHPLAKPADLLAVSVETLPHVAQIFAQLPAVSGETAPAASH